PVRLPRTAARSAIAAAWGLRLLPASPHLFDARPAAARAHRPDVRRRPRRRPARQSSSRSFSARWITHTATAMSSAGSVSSRTTSTP
ncbi:hypothetical protein ACWEN3_13310, partial [Streptomyces sp. NPDC004561]